MESGEESYEEVKTSGGVSKPPLYQNKKNFAAEMVKNRKRYLSHLEYAPKGASGAG